MATKKNLEIRNLSTEDLTHELEENQKNYIKMKFDHAIQSIENPLSLREMRRDIARMKTELRNREVANFSEEDVAKRSKIRARRR